MLPEKAIAKVLLGVAPEAIIKPIRGSSAGANNGFTSLNIAASIKYAVDNGAHIINMSLGGIGTSGVEGEAISYALKQGITIIAASGNAGTIVSTHPASYSGVIAVASNNDRDEISAYSSRSPHISIAAPGESIYSLAASTVAKSSASYIDYSGTSMVAPYVSGLAALIKQKYSAATPAQIKEILETTAKDIGSAGFDYASGHGRVDPVKALAASLPTTTWTEVEYTVTYASNTLESYGITVLDNNNNFFTAALTDASGVASFFFFFA